MRDNTRKQPHLSSKMQFPCANSTLLGVGKSKVKPVSVHKLRPGDIDVIGAMGDSLVAGNGAMEEWALGTMIEYRGISWCAGKSKIYLILCVSNSIIEISKTVINTKKVK